MEPLSVALHAVRLAQPAPGERVVVFGAGPIGLCALAVIKGEMEAAAAVVDISPRRLEVARRLGADLVVDARREDVVEAIAAWTGRGAYGSGARADVALEWAGAPVTFRQALNVVRHGGRVVQVAMQEEPLTVSPAVLVSKELRLLGSIGSSGDDFAGAIRLLRSGRVSLDPAVTHRIPLESVPAAFAEQAGSPEAIKIIVHPSGALTGTAPPTRAGTRCGGGGGLSHTSKLPVCRRSVSRPPGRWGNRPAGLDVGSRRGVVAGDVSIQVPVTE